MLHLIPLHLLPAPLHRALCRAADRTRRLWWRVRKPRGRSVHVVAFDDAGRVLLVRHSYGPPVWAVPGGGVGRHEEPAAAAAREMREELSCALSRLVAAGSYEDQLRPSRGQQTVFAASLAGAPIADRREIVAVEWFDLAQLPANVSRHVAPLIELAQEARS